MNNTLQRINDLKEHGQDFEWYPTTDTMIDVVFTCMTSVSSVLDIGAGDGRVLERLDKLTKQYAALKYEHDHYHNYPRSIEKYAIEKAKIHIENMPPDIAIVGTDFMLNSIFDKKVDTVFCNPPYSEYEAWAVKTIKEADAKTVFLVLPQRWKDSKLIEDALKRRKSMALPIWSGTFADADRAARGTVDIIKIVLKSESDRYSGYNEDNDTDPFNVWFDEHFSDFAALEHVKEKDEDGEKKPSYKHIVKGQNIIEHLHQFYVKEMNSLLSNYKNLSKLDAALLDELGVSVRGIKSALKQKIEGTKTKYWQELFDNLDKITDRLTSSSRQTMLEKMRARCNVDFSIENAYAVVLWVIKNANGYIDSQLVEVFKELSEPECVKNYKSNQRVWQRGEWRRDHEGKHSHYKLEYRIITSKHTAIDESSYSYRRTRGLAEVCHKFIGDIMTVAHNLGFISQNDSEYMSWSSGKKNLFYGSDGDILLEVKAFKNGNLHFRFGQKFMKAFNVEASRLLGWIHTTQEAAEELEYDIEFVESRFQSNMLLGVRDGQKLLNK